MIVMLLILRLFNSVSGEFGWGFYKGGDYDNGVYGESFSPSNIPGGRKGAVSWTFSSTNESFIFGGYGFAKYHDMGYLNDLWVLKTDELTNELLLKFIEKEYPDGKNVQENQPSTCKLQRLGRDCEYDPTESYSPLNFLSGRAGASVQTLETTQESIIFFGYGVGIDDKESEFGYLQDIWYFRNSDYYMIEKTSFLETNGDGGECSNCVMGECEGPYSECRPSGRRNPATWITANEENLIIFGGYGIGPRDTESVGYLNDLFFIKLANMEVKWTLGGSTINNNGIYMKAFYSQKNCPGARSNTIFWKEGGIGYIFGGVGPNGEELSDFWGIQIEDNSYGTKRLNNVYTYYHSYTSNFGLLEEQEIEISSNLFPKAYKTSFFQYDEETIFFYGGESNSNLLSYFYEMVVHVDEEKLEFKYLRFGSGGGLRNLNSPMNSDSVNVHPNYDDQIDEAFNSNVFPGSISEGIWIRIPGEDRIFFSSGKTTNNKEYSNDIWELEEYIWKCNEILTSNPWEGQGCSGPPYGICLLNWTCLCLNEYLETEGKCQNWNCYDYNYNSNEVCSGRGECVSPNTCVCDDDNWGGNECEHILSYCYNIPFFYPTVCSSHGICENNNTCICSDHYYGEECEEFYCNNISVFSSKSICSGHGVCKDHDLCDCFPEYYGEKCGIYNCSNIPNNNASVCSSHGICIGPEICECYNKNNNNSNNISITSNSFTSEPQYYGKYCDTKISTISYFKGVYSVRVDYEFLITPQLLMQFPVDFGNRILFNCFGDFEDEIYPNILEKSFDNYLKLGYILELVDDNNTISYDLDQFGIDEQMCVWRIKEEEEEGDIGIIKKVYHLDIFLHENNILEVGDLLSIKVLSSNQTVIIKINGTKEFDDDDYYDSNDIDYYDENNEEEDENNPIVLQSIIFGNLFLFLIFISGILICCSCILCFLIYYFCFSFILFTFFCFSSSCLGIISYLCCQFQLQYLNKNSEKKNLLNLISFKSSNNNNNKMIEEPLISNFDFLNSSTLDFDDFSISEINRNNKKFSEEDEDEELKLKINTDLYKINFDEIKINYHRILGDGGSKATVYFANWRNNEVAIKLFRTREICSSSHSYEDFEKELALCSSLSHPNIVRFFGATLKPPKAGIVMEFCVNGEILNFIIKKTNKSGHPFPISRKLRWMMEITEALEFLHSRNIIHRDVKPENILLDSEEHCKLMDFGISRIIKGRNKIKTSRIGTSSYMAPEVANSGKYDCKCDSFSFSILFFSILSELEEPYEGYENIGSMCIEFQVANNPEFRPKIEKILKSIDNPELNNNNSSKNNFDWIEDIILRCWDHDPENRYDFKELSMIFQKKIQNINKQNEDEEDEKYDVKSEEEEELEEESDEFIEMEIKSPNDDNDNFDHEEFYIECKKETEEEEEEEELILLEDQNQNTFFT